MKLTLREIWNANQAIGKILNFDGLEAKLAYRLSKIGKKFITELKAIDDVRSKLVQKYSSKEFPNQVDPKNNKKFNDEFDELMREEIEMEVEIILYELWKKVNLTASDLINLEKFIEPPKDEIKE